MLLRLNQSVQLFLFGLFLLSNTTVHAQTIDSLKVDTLISVLTYEKRDTQTVDAYLHLSDEYQRVVEYEIALTYADLAKDLARDISYREGALQAYLKLGHIYAAYYLDFLKSLRYYDKALEIAKELNSDLDLIAVYKGYSLLYSSVKNYQLAIEYNEKALEIANRLTDNRLISDLTAYGGSMYEDKGDTVKAIEMYKEVERIEQAENFMYTTNASLTTIAHYYFLIGDIKRSLKQYRSAIIRFERLQDQRWVSYGHAEIAWVCIADNDLELAEKHALKGLEVADQFNLNKERGDNYRVLARVYKLMGNDEKANEFQSALDLLMDSVMVDLDERMIDAEAENSREEISDPLYSGIKNAVIILAMMGIVLLISGLTLRKRG